MKQEQKQKHNGCRLAALLLIGACPALAGDELVELQPATVPTFVEQRTTVTTSYEVSDSDLERRSAVTLEEVVEGIPGVQAGSRAGDDVRIAVRGSGLQNVVFTKANGIDLLLDGFPVGGADGNFDYSLVSPILAEKVDVLIGAGGNRYGALTLGGVIDFISPTALDAGNRARLDVGSFGFVRGALNQGWTDGNWDAMAQAEVRRTDGYRDFSNGDAQKLAFNLGWQGENGITNRSFLNYSRVYQDIALPITRQEMEDDPKQGRVNGPPGNFNMNELTQPFYETNSFRLANRTRFPASEEMFWELGAYYLFRDIDFRRPSLPPTRFLLGPGWLEARSNDLGGHLTATSDRPLAGQPNRFTGGVRMSGMWGNEELFPNIATRKGPKFADGDLWAGNLVAFFENEWMAAEDWTVIAGARAFYSERDYEDKMPGSPNGDLDQDYTGIAPKIGLSNTSVEGLRIFGSFARNIQPPTFGDIIAIPVAPPPPQRIALQRIDEQKAWVAEIGLGGETEPTQWQISLYYSWLKDEIIRFSPPGSPPVGNQIGRNADRTVHYGIEASARQILWHDGAYDEGDRLALRASYTIREHRFDDDKTFGDNELAGVPTQLLFAELLYESAQGWYAGPNISGIPSSFYIDNANTFKADGFVLFGLRAGWEQGSWALFAELSNLLDEAYPAAWQNVVDARGQDQSVFFPGDGRAFNVGFEYRW